MAGGKGVAVQIARESTTVKPFKVESLAAHVNAIFDAISRRAYEIFEGSGYAPGRELDYWFRAERELLHPVHHKSKLRCGTREEPPETPPGGNPGCRRGFPKHIDDGR